MPLLDSLKRLQLRRRGLSCGKVRRKHGGNELLRVLSSSPWVKTLIFLMFFVGTCILVTSHSPEGSLASARPGVAVAVTGVLFVLLLAYYFVNHPRNFVMNVRTLLIFGAIWFQLLLIKLTAVLLEGIGWPPVALFAMVPFAVAPMALSVLLGRSFGLLATAACSILGCLLVPMIDAFPFAITSLVCGFVGVLFTQRVRKRGRILRAGFFVGVASALLAVLFGHIGFLLPGETVAPEGRDLALRALIPLGIGIVTGLVVGGFLPMLEGMFQATTTISWIEMADLNHPLLKRLTLEAPGTYHHSLLVATLAEAGAEAIGANAPLCRVCAYFHDIGKLVKPEYFIENIGNADNPHDGLNPTMSALVIISHVKEGVDLAVKQRLHDTIIDVIEQHHGNSLVLFFHRKALAARDEIQKRAKDDDDPTTEADVPKVDEKSFRYPGPKPQFRESAILSLADAIESASRSLEKPTPQRIEGLVEDIINARILDGQLEECDLTLQELAELKNNFSTTLRSMLHNRIAYPKDKEEEGKNGKKGNSKKSKSRKSTESKEAEAAAAKGSKRPSSPPTSGKTKNSPRPTPVTAPVAREIGQ